ncbi:sensor histidine kinase [Marinicella gelatinilytica]|uniref:sensor histidine kinase n=1 Tax=Marinicella gelatinilytica TaxID=2996017 RepID=UPI00226098C0|nr:HAMP domain-containing sensor histidine kinase [Marinicella gelatinilytica]MCX7544988.1 HAMP domain-containing sensor histidine kinase [Marinicella gelatinilytica]
MTKAKDIEKIAQIERKNLRYLNLFRLFAGLFFYMLVNDHWVDNFYQVDYFHPSVFWVVNTYLGLSIWVMLSTFLMPQKVVIIISKIMLFVDLLFLIYMAYGSNGFAQGLAILAVLPIGSAAMLYRKPMNILMAPFTATALLWFMPEVIDFSSQATVSQSSLLLHALAYFLIALLGIRQSVSYASTVHLYKSQRKTISGLENMNQVIIEKMSQGVIVYQHDYVVLHANQAAKNLLNDDELFFIPDAIIEHIEQKQDSQIYHSDQGLDLYIRKTKLNTVKNFGVLFIEDSSFLKKAAQQLNLASLGKLSSSIAHEIRNPLAAISTASELLAQSEHLYDEDRQIANIITNQTERANHIIEDILAMSRRSTAKPEEQPLFPALKKLKQELIVQGLGEAKSIHIICPQDKTIHFDSKHLQQVLWNLGSNALRHGKSGGVTISVHNNRIDFKNSGEPLKTSTQKNLFEPFFTTHNRGTGLGLHICRQLCHDNHARLTYHHINGNHVFRIDFNLDQD